MKKIMLIFIIGLSLVTFGCNKERSNLKVGNESNIEIVDSPVTLNLKKNTLTRTNATFILKNNSLKDIEYGNPYEIEKLINGKWYKIDASLNFTLPAYELKSGDEILLELDWKDIYGSLPNGDYRVIKSVSIPNKNEILENVYISANFSIDSK